MEERLTANGLSGLQGYHLRRASKHVQEDLARTLEPFDLRMITFSALSIIAENDGLRQFQLAELLTIERPNLVVIVDELEGNGLIRRDQVKTDRRAYALRITKVGKKRLEDALHAVEAHEKRLFGDLSDEERQALKSALKSIAQNSREEGDHG